MRVIAGRFRGAVLAAPPGTGTRPMTDRVKEALFNILGHRFGRPGFLPDSPVLDLFAGSGALGIECLSRGASRCVFVECERRALRVLRANLAKLRITDAAQVIADNAWTVRCPPAAPDGYGLIFIDPPYRDAADPPRVLSLLARIAPRLAPEGVLVFRCAAPAGLPLDQVPALRRIDERRFGSMRIVLLARADAAP